MSNNMAIWDSVNRPPQSALKTIGGGRLKGFTDINPQWRIQAMTELFGPCGIGWKYNVDKLGLEPLGKDGEVMAYAIVTIWYKNPLVSDGVWSEPVQGVGGSMAVAKEILGLKVSDECHKMAITDALGVAMKALGVGADIYMGRWDGSKYSDAPPIKEGSVTTSTVSRDSAKKKLDQATTYAALESVWKALSKEEREAVKGLLDGYKEKLQPKAASPA